MKKLFCLLAVLGLAGGCQCRQAEQPKEIVAKVNNYEITKDEFDREFRESGYGRSNTPASRKEFLNNLIDRKLILQDAQQQGLDKEAGFLRMIEKFWEQSLLKVALDKKIKEVTSRPGMDEARQSAAIDEWVADLHEKANIEIREELLEEGVSQ